jgi:hypothetical protein
VVANALSKAVFALQTSICGRHCKSLLVDADDKQAYTSAPAMFVLCEGEHRRPRVISSPAHWWPR